MKEILGAEYFPEMESSPKVIRTTVDALLPGIASRSFVSSLDLEIGEKKDDKGDLYYLRFPRLFNVNDVDFLFNFLIDKNPPIPQKTNPGETNKKVEGSKKRTDFYQVDDKDREEFDAEAEKFSKLKQDPILELSSDIFTPDRARNDFLRGRNLGRSYQYLFDTDKKDAYLAYFKSEIAKFMKSNPDLWRRKTSPARVGDDTAIGRYAQLNSNDINKVHSQYLNRFSESDQAEIISRHMQLLYAAKPLLDLNDVIRGYLTSTSEISKRVDNGWGVVKDGVAIQIRPTGNGFSIAGHSSHILIPEVSWRKNGMRHIENSEEVVEEVKIVNPNTSVEMVYNLTSENVSKLVGFMLLDQISNVRNHLPGKHIASERILEDVYARRHALINSELVRSAEGLLAA